MMRKRKKPKDYKIRIFTAILFLIIVFLVSTYSPLTRRLNFLIYILFFHICFLLNFLRSVTLT